MKEGLNITDVHKAIEMIHVEIDNNNNNKTIQINDGDHDGELINNRSNRQMIVGNQ